MELTDNCNSLWWHSIASEFLPERKRKREEKRAFSELDASPGPWFPLLQPGRAQLCDDTLTDQRDQPDRLYLQDQRLALTTIDKKFSAIVGLPIAIDEHVQPLVTIICTTLQRFGSCVIPISDRTNSAPKHCLLQQLLLYLYTQRRDCSASKVHTCSPLLLNWTERGFDCMQPWKD